MKRLPDVGELVLVRIGGEETVLRSRIEDTRTPGFVSIAIPSDGMTEHELERTTAVTLEWIVSTGLGSVTGTVAGRIEVGVPALSIKLDAEPIVNQRREHARAELVLELELQFAGTDAEPISGVTLDVSGGGLRAVISVPLEPDSLVHVSVELPSGMPVDALARVVDQREDGVVALKFEEIVPGDRERLIQAVFNSYRTQALVRRPG
jgi:c-di-GMP-binding flagellar brake protein YcgR